MASKYKVICVCITWYQPRHDAECDSVRRNLPVLASDYCSYYLSCILFFCLNIPSRDPKAEAGLSPQKLGGQLRSRISMSPSPQMPSRTYDYRAEPGWQITTKTPPPLFALTHLSRLRPPCAPA